MAEKQERESASLRGQASEVKNAAPAPASDTTLQQGRRLRSMDSSSTVTDLTRLAPVNGPAWTDDSVPQRRCLGFLILRDYHCQKQQHEINDTERFLSSGLLQSPHHPPPFKSSNAFGQNQFF